MWGRFPSAGQMGQNSMMGPNQMGPNPVMGPYPMMGPNPMGPNQARMMGPGPCGGWERFPSPSFTYPGSMMDPSSQGLQNPFPNSGQLMPEGVNNPRMNTQSEDRIPERGSLSPFEKETSRRYEEPDSSTSFEGKRHKGKKAEESEEEEEADYNVGPYCDLCELHLPSAHMLWRHMSGKKHMKALKAMDAGRPLPKKIQERKAENPSSSNVGEEVSSIEKSFASLTADEPVVGLGFVVETFDQSEDLFICELCGSKCNQNNMVLHVIGVKHRMAYLKRCDPERYARLKKTQKRSKLTEDTRQLCKEVESTMGRGRPRYKGPKQRDTDRNINQYKRRELSTEERRMAMEDLKRILLQDFTSRNLDPGTVQEMLEERMQLMKEYEKRGVSFDLAKERVVEDEDRWNLLLEFERQTLSFDEAEERISYRMDLLKAYIVNDCPKEEARKRVLDDEVIRDFRKEFQRLGMERHQAQKHVEKRFWMLERLHYKGFSQGAASRKVMKIERELSRILQTAKEESEKHIGVSELFSWMKAAEDLEAFIEMTFHELGLSSSQREKHIKLSLDYLDKYKKENVPVDMAKKRVLVDDLPVLEDDVEESKAEASASTPPEEPATSASTSSVGAKEDVMQRIKVFMTKLHALLEIDQQGPSPVNREKQLAMFDQLSQLEMQSLLSDMIKSNLNAIEAKKRFVDFFQQHECLRKSLFPFTNKDSSISNPRLSMAFKLFMDHFSLSIDELSAQNLNKSSKDKSSLDDSPKYQGSRSRSRDHRRHSSRRRRSRSRSTSTSTSRSSSVHHRRRRWTDRSKRSTSPSYPSTSKGPSRSRHERKGKRSPSPRHKRRYHSRERSRSNSPEYGREKSRSPYYQRKGKRRR